MAGSEATLLIVLTVHGDLAEHVLVLDRVPLGIDLEHDVVHLEQGDHIVDVVEATDPVTLRYRDAERPEPDVRRPWYPNASGSRQHRCDHEIGCTSAREDGSALMTPSMDPQ
jgi:hypothetical protein